MNCPCCDTPLETQKIASVNFDLCHSCLGVWFPRQAVGGIVSARGISSEQFMATLLERLRTIELNMFADKLTCLGNRRFFDHQLHAEIARAKGSHYLSLILMDLDGFKFANDNHGHATGDLVLKDFSGILMHITRKSDCAARTGGDEFALVLPETDATGTKAIAERIIHETAQRKFLSIDNKPLKHPITVCCGIASYPPDFGENAPDNLDLLAKQLYNFSDTALYAAKGQGNGKCVHYGEMVKEFKLLPSIDEKNSR